MPLNTYPKICQYLSKILGDKKIISSQGFTDIRVVGVNTPFKGITITKIPGQHGNDEMISDPIHAENCGDSMQFY